MASVATRPSSIPRVKPWYPVTLLLWLLHDSSLLTPSGSNSCMREKSYPASELGESPFLSAAWQYRRVTWGGCHRGLHLLQQSISSTTVHDFHWEEMGLGVSAVPGDHHQDPELSQQLPSKLVSIYYHLFWFIFFKNECWLK